MSWAAPAASDDEAIAALRAAYARAVQPGEEADRYNHLFADVFRRAKRSHVTDVDLPALAAVAMKTLEPLPAGLGDPGEVFRKAMREALRSLDPYSRFMDASLPANDRAEGSSPDRRRAWQADPAQLLGGIPMVVLLDARSASASELVADALQQNGRATVMGQRSFGKGSVQTSYSLGDHGTLKLTTAIYYGPTGKTLHGAGVIPDIELLAATKSVSASAAATSLSKVRVDPVRCAPVKVRDPALACAVGYLQDGSLETFTARLAPAVP